jgi:hypothetical protein
MPNVFGAPGSSQDGANNPSTSRDPDAQTNAPFEAYQMDGPEAIREARCVKL